MTDTMTSETLHTQIAALIAQIVGLPLDAELERGLNAEHGRDSATYLTLLESQL
ncbi:MAG: hypothetical protein LBQ20_02035 [Rhodanobacter sp.]|jgi:hypothetical protein|nr:hypothetical protein [Rhodanobacter sp.]